MTNALLFKNQALHKLETDDAANGQIFNITDDNPTGLGFILNPMFAKLTGEKEKNFPEPNFFIPFWVLHFISRYFALLSIVLGKRFELPFLGFTIMETYKVSKDD
jgi:hypothetical protein